LSHFVFENQKFVTYEDFDFILEKCSLGISETNFIISKINFKISENGEYKESEKMLCENLLDSFKNDFEKKNFSQTSKTYDLNFHQTFQPESQYLSSILLLASQNAELTVKEISLKTGIPNGEKSGKVEPHILYANFMNLILFSKNEDKYSLKLTELGKKVFEEDRNFQEELTILLCHCMISKKDSKAICWNFCFNELFPAFLNSISENQYLISLNAKVNGKANIRNIAPFKNSYSNFFSKLNLLKIENEEIKLYPNRIKNELVYLYAYVLLDCWNLFFYQRNEISFDELETIGFRFLFGWDKDYEGKILDLLERKSIVKVNHQLIPQTVIRLREQSQMLENLYSELL